MSDYRALPYSATVTSIGNGNLGEPAARKPLAELGQYHLVWIQTERSGFTGLVETVHRDKGTGDITNLDIHPYGLFSTTLRFSPPQCKQDPYEGTSFMGELKTA